MTRVMVAHSLLLPLLCAAGGAEFKKVISKYLISFCARKVPVYYCCHVIIAGNILPNMTQQMGYMYVPIDGKYRKSKIRSRVLELSEDAHGTEGTLTVPTPCP